MRQLAPLLYGSISLASTLVSGAASAACSKPYTRVLPYDLPLGTEQASILIHNEVRFDYDCETLLTQSVSEAKVQFLKLKLNLLQGELSATQTLNGPGAGYARLTVAGFEVSRQDFTLDKIFDKTIQPDTDFDFSQTKLLFVGPIAVPISYGIEGNAALRIKAQWKNIGLEAEANPKADAKVYVQGSADLKVLEVIARGDMQLLRDRLTNKLRASFEDDGQLYLRLEAASLNELEAFDGSVLLRAQSGKDAGQEIFERQLFAWKGISRDDKLAEFSDRVLFLR